MKSFYKFVNYNYKIRIKMEWAQISLKWRSNYTQCICCCSDWNVNNVVTAIATDNLLVSRIKTLHLISVVEYHEIDAKLMNFKKNKLK